MPDNGATVPAEDFERIDSEVHHLRERQAEDRIGMRDLDTRLRAVEVAVSGLGREMKIWGSILGALVIGVLMAVLTKR